jgi:hypothetical protein
MPGNFVATRSVRSRSYPEALPGRDAHAALADAKVQKLVDVGRLLEQDVLADDAEVCGRRARRRRPRRRA